MIITENSIVYCDANFLIALAEGKRKELKQPERKRARVLFAQLLISKCKIIVSTLTFDETWLGIRKELGPKAILNNSLFTLNKLLNRFGLRLKNYGASEFSCSEIFDDLNSFTNKLLNHKNFSVVQFNNAANGVKKALANINNLKFKPRDSFHVAIMHDNSATHFISNDSDFVRNKGQIGVNIINF